MRAKCRGRPARPAGTTEEAAIPPEITSHSYDRIVHDQRFDSRRGRDFILAQDAGRKRRLVIGTHRELLQQTGSWSVI
jgi:hypothetical protein